MLAAHTFVHKGRMTRFRRNVKMNSERLRVSEDVTIKTEGLQGIKEAILSSERSREHLTQATNTIRTWLTSRQGNATTDIDCCVKRRDKRPILFYNVAKIKHQFKVMLTNEMDRYWKGMWLAIKHGKQNALDKCELIKTSVNSNSTGNWSATELRELNSIC